MDIPEPDQNELTMDLGGVYRKYYGYAEVGSAIVIANHFRKYAKQLEQENDRLMTMLKATGYGPTRIDAYVHQTEEMQRLSELNSELIDLLHSIHTDAETALDAAEETADYTEDG